MNEKIDIFLKQMRGVRPINKNNRIQKDKQVPIKKIIKKKTEIKTVNSIVKKNNTIIKNSEFVLENLNIKKSIKNKLFKIDKKIDFHGASLLDAEESFSNTITHCYNNGLRCLLFVTGKGLFNGKKNDGANTPKLYHGVIRSAFFSWVKSKKFAKQILSYEKASAEHGGDGAFYVYLRKRKN